MKVTIRIKMKINIKMKTNIITKIQILIPTCTKIKIKAKVGVTIAIEMAGAESQADRGESQAAVWLKIEDREKRSMLFPSATVCANPLFCCASLASHRSGSAGALPRTTSLRLRNCGARVSETPSLPHVHLPPRHAFLLLCGRLLSGSRRGGISGA